MEVKLVVSLLKKENLLDKKEIYVYGSAKNIIGGAIGSIRGLALLSINENILYNSSC